jgi:hypothetical protein
MDKNNRVIMSNDNLIDLKNRLNKAHDMILFWQYKNGLNCQEANNWINTVKDIHRTLIDMRDNFQVLADKKSSGPAHDNLIRMISDINSKLKESKIIMM